MCVVALLSVRGGTMRADLCVFRFFYLPGLARNCVLSFFVPVVVIKVKGTRDFVLSYFVPVVGMKVKGTMELGEFRLLCVVTQWVARGDAVVRAW